jgi:hypothetical protein
MSRKVVTVLSLLASLLVVSTAAHSQTKVFGQYWEWPNTFHNNGTFKFTPGTGSNPQWYESFNVPSGNLYGYPASIRGYHYGYNPSGDTLFPKEMSTISHIPAAFSYASSGSNMKGDFTYDMFLRYDNDVKSGQSNPQLEVMVWGGNASYPISASGSPIAYSVVESDGYTWDLYYGDNSAAGYYTYSFVPHRSSPPATLPKSGSVNVDLRLFFNALKGRSNYSESMYLDVVEAGCEITEGDGDVQTTYFTVDAY